VAATDALCRSFLDLWWHFDPSGATAGRLADFSAESIRQHVVGLRAIAAATEELEVEEVDDEIDRTALLDHLRVLLFRFEHEHPYRTNPLLWTEHLFRSFSMLGRGDQDEALEAAAALERLRALPAFCDRARESIRRPPAILLRGAAEQLGELSTLIGGVQDRFATHWSAEGADPESLLAEARTGLEELGDAFADEIVPDQDPHAGAIGEAEADRRLHHEHASIHNAGEVWRAALRTAEEVEREVEGLAASLDSGRPWPDVYRAAAGAPVPATEMEQEFDRWRERARAFAITRSIVPPVAVAPFEVEPARHADRRAALWAEYRMSEAGIGRIALGDLPRACLPWVAARFGEPGLHYHASATRELPTLVRRHIVASSTTGGFGLHIQELLAEAGFCPEPEARLVARVLMLRQVTLALVDIGIHTRQLSAEEGIGYLSERIPFDRRLALGEVRRVLADPLAACATLLGRDELRRLHSDHRATRAGQVESADVHRRLFGFGGIPIPLIRWGMGLDA